MAANLGISEQSFLDDYTHSTSLGLSLNEKSADDGYDCVFLDRETMPGKAICGVYEARPSQCRTWPFWPENLRSPESWERASRGCPGMNTGKLHSVEVVQMTVERALADR